MTEEHKKSIGDICEKIDLFMGSSNRNGWIENDEFNLYIRRSMRYINGQMVQCLDLANINVREKGQKLFTSVLEHLIKDKAYNIFIESVMDERFKTFFIKYGFTPINDTPIVFNLYRLKTV